MQLTLAVQRHRRPRAARRAAPRWQQRATASRLMRQEGFSVAELLVAASVAISVIAAVATFNQFQFSAVQDEARQNALQMGARNAVDLFTREVRRAGANPTCAPGITAITSAKHDSMRLLADLDGDGATTDFGEDVTYLYRFDNQRFERTGSKRGTDALIDGATLTGSQLRYFDQNGLELEPDLGVGLTAAQLGVVRRIRIELVATRPAKNAARSGPLRVELANDVEIRNRYFGNAVSCP